MFAWSGIPGQWAASSKLLSTKEQDHPAIKERMWLVQNDKNMMSIFFLGFDITIRGFTS
jgi:hypothetical protein